MQQKAVAVEHRQQKLLRILCVHMYTLCTAFCMHSMTERMKEKGKTKQTKESMMKFQINSLVYVKIKFSDLQWNANSSQPFSNDYINQFRFSNRSLFVVMMKPLVLTILATIILQVCSILLHSISLSSHQNTKIMCKITFQLDYLHNRD